MTSSGDDETDKNMARYNLPEDYSTETDMIFDMSCRHAGEWNLPAVGEGYLGGRAVMCAQYGIYVE